MKALGFPMAMQFSPDDSGGYLYRKDQIGPALPATANERDSYVGWMGWMVVLGTVLYFFAVVAMSVLADRYVTSDNNAVQAIGASVMALLALAFIYGFLRWASHAPARAFVGRPELAPAKTRQNVFGKRLAQLSYTRIVLGAAGMSAVLLFSSGGDPITIWMAVLLPAIVGIGLAIWKWRVTTT